MFRFINRLHYLQERKSIEVEKFKVNKIIKTSGIPMRGKLTEKKSLNLLFLFNVCPSISSQKPNNFFLHFKSLLSVFYSDINERFSHLYQLFCSL